MSTLHVFIWHLDFYFIKKKNLVKFDCATDEQSAI